MLKTFEKSGYTCSVLYSVVKETFGLLDRRANCLCASDSIRIVLFNRTSTERLWVILYCFSWCKAHFVCSPNSDLTSWSLISWFESRQAPFSSWCPVGAAGDSDECDSVGAAQTPRWLFLLHDTVCVNSITLDGSDAIVLTGCYALSLCVSEQCLLDK